MRRVLKTFFFHKNCHRAYFSRLFFYVFYCFFLTVLTVIITLILLMEERTVKRLEEEPRFFEVWQNRFLLLVK